MWLQVSAPPLSVDGPTGRDLEYVTFDLGKFWQHSLTFCRLFIILDSTATSTDNTKLRLSQSSALHMFPYSSVGHLWVGVAAAEHLEQVCEGWSSSVQQIIIIRTHIRQAGRQRDWRPCRQRTEKGIPLIRRWSGTMAALLSVPFFALTYHQVCVRRPCSRLHSCVSAPPKDIYPNPTAVKDDRKCPINDPDKADGEGETCVGSLLRRGHTTWPSAEVTCSGRGRAAGCFVANFRPHANSQTRAGHTWYKKDAISTNSLKLSPFKG